MRYGSDLAAIYHSDFHRYLFAITVNKRMNKDSVKVCGSSIILLIDYTKPDPWWLCTFVAVNLKHFVPRNQWCPRLEEGMTPFKQDLQLTSKSICQDCGGASMRFIMRRAEIDIENTSNPMHIILRLNVDPKVIGLSNMASRMVTLAPVENRVTLGDLHCGAVHSLAPQPPTTINVLNIKMRAGLFILDG